MSSMMHVHTLRFTNPGDVGNVRYEVSADANQIIFSKVDELGSQPFMSFASLDDQGGDEEEERELSAPGIDVFGDLRVEGDLTAGGVVRASQFFITDGADEKTVLHSNGYVDGNLHVGQLRVDRLDAQSLHVGNVRVEATDDGEIRMDGTLDAHDLVIGKTHLASGGDGLRITTPSGADASTVHLGGNAVIIQLDNANVHVRPNNVVFDGAFGLARDENGLLFTPPPGGGDNRIDDVVCTTLACSNNALENERAVTVIGETVDGIPMVRYCQVDDEAVLGVVHKHSEYAVDVHGLRVRRAHGTAASANALLTVAVHGIANVWVATPHDCFPRAGQLIQASSNGYLSAQTSNEYTTRTMGRLVENASQNVYVPTGYVDSRGNEVMSLAGSTLAPTRQLSQKTVAFQMKASL